MAQQTKSASNRSNGASAGTRSGSSAGSRTKAKPRSNARDSSPGSVVERLKAPALAGGAAVAGLLGGIVLARRGPATKLLGTRTASKNLAEAAKQIGSFGEHVGELATEVRMVREGVANTRSRSPVEVVLQGLTSRRR